VSATVDRATPPWTASYPPGTAAPEAWGTALQLWRSAAAIGGDTPCLHTLDGDLSWTEVDGRSDALAASLLDRGLIPGSRVAVLLQNDPEWLVTMLATWKASSIAVALNPMFKERELRYHLADSGAAVLVCRGELFTPSVTEVVAATRVQRVLLVDPERAGALPRSVERFDDVVADGERSALTPAEPSVDDVAVLTYTSGTTGTPKGAMNTHGNLAHNATVAADWYRLGGDDVVLGVAPLFHITGLVLHMAVSWHAGVPLVLLQRFDPEAAVAAAARYEATFTVGSITVFAAMIDRGGLDRAAAPMLTKLASGGAPIAGSTLARIEEATGRYVHNVYGMTETTSPSHAVPLGSRAPVDAGGAVSVGVPVPGAMARVVDLETGAELPPGEAGEIVIEGPMVVPGYWEKPEDSERTMGGGLMRTGDVGVMDEDGWFYVIDRIKDQINASGYKVWPREVEDVLYEHPEVQEAVVVGVDDPYRGETVKAFVVLADGADATGDDLIDFCRQRLAAYKYPRSVEIRDELPKTPTGKFLRRRLREESR
jgi:long-chain acyl-CoA synthetase